MVILTPLLFYLLAFSGRPHSFLSATVITIVYLVAMVLGARFMYWSIQRKAIDHARVMAEEREYLNREHR